MIRFFLSLPFLVVALALTIPLIIIMLPIGLFVFLCNKTNQYIESTGTAWDEIIQYEPSVGWKPRPFLNDSKYFDPFDDFGTITTDDEGWPGKTKISETDIVVFGDSFAFGFGSEFEKAYYNVQNSVDIKPVAAPGYNMVQALLLMKRYREQIKEKLVVWFICLGNDPMENFNAYHQKLYPNPFIRNKGSTEDWEILSEHIHQNRQRYAGNGEFDYTRYFANICIESPYSNRVYSGVHYLVKEGKKLCDSIGSELVIFTIPNKYQLDKEGRTKLKGYLQNEEKFDPEYPDLMIGNICKKVGTPFISGKDYLTVEDYKLRDPHWNNKGNKKVSQIISDYYKEKYTD